jgi:hypothetical protein
MPSICQLLDGLCLRDFFLEKLGSDLHRLFKDSRLFYDILCGRCFSRLLRCFCNLCSLFDGLRLVGRFGGFFHRRRRGPGFRAFSQGHQAVDIIDVGAGGAEREQGHPAARACAIGGKFVLERQAPADYSR